MATLYVCKWCGKVFTWHEMYRSHVDECAAKNEGGPKDPLMKKQK